MRRGAIPIRAGGPVAAGAPERSKGGPGGGPPFAFRWRNPGSHPEVRPARGSQVPLKGEARRADMRPGVFWSGADGNHPVAWSFRRRRGDAPLSHSVLVNRPAFHAAGDRHDLSGDVAGEDVGRRGTRPPRRRPRAGRPCGAPSSGRSCGSPRGRRGRGSSATPSSPGRRRSPAPSARPGRPRSSARGGARARPRTSRPRSRRGPPRRRGRRWTRSARASRGLRARARAGTRAR